MYYLKRVSFTLMLTAGVGYVHSESVMPPDSSQLMQDANNLENEATVMPQLDGLTFEGAPLSETPQGGPKVPLKTLVFSGNTLFDNDQLQAVLVSSLAETTYDLAGLRALANQVSVFYREQGYTFAKAFVPSQDFNSGELTIEIVEGRYGVVKTTGERELAEKTQGFLVDLKLDDVIYAPKLERSVLILSDQPGVLVVPVIQPSGILGRGDLMVSVREGKRYEGSVGVDNYGNRYSGSYRALLDLSANSLLTVGDELSFNIFRTNEATWLGGVQYEMPVGFSGLRAAFGYSHLDYKLADEFGEGFTGSSQTRSLQLTYPLVRSMDQNVTLLGKYSSATYKDMRGIGVEDSKEADNIQFGLQFDRRDGFYGGGVTYGNVFSVSGSVNETSSSTDQDFHVYKAQIARLQSLKEDFSLFGTVSGQYSSDSVNGTQQSGLGGVNGVRAYPQGEGSGSKTVLAQVELRYNIEEYQPFAFYDFGNRLEVEDELSRNISGIGIGVRYAYEQFSTELVSAWKVNGGDSLSDSKQKNPRLWFKANYRF